jgi:hypothetical protein
MTLRDDPETMIRSLARDELSARSRLGYVTILLAAAAMTCIVVLLLFTERGVPGRAQFAFVAMAAIGLSWVGLATWVLTTKRVLAARDRVIAGWMAVSFTFLYFAFAVFAALISGRWSSVAGVAIAAAMVWFAVRVLRKAQRRRSELLARRAELEQQLAG